MKSIIVEITAARTSFAMNPPVKMRVKGSAIMQITMTEPRTTAEERMAVGKIGDRALALAFVWEDAKR